MNNSTCLRCGYIFKIKIPIKVCWKCGSNRWNITREDAFWEKFWSYVDKNGPVPPHCPELGPCWMWIGPVRNQWKYGAISRNNKHLLATHVMLEIHDGVDVPSGMVVLHGCDNPPCVNPNHLRIGTKAENALDMFKKGRRKYNKQLINIHEDVRRIRKLHKNGLTTKELSKQYNISLGTIQRMVYRRTYAYIN